MVTYEQPYGKPAAPERIVITIDIGDGMRTPDEVIRAVVRAMGEYGRDHHGTLTPFAQQPGVPGGVVRSDAERIVGEWRITS